MKDEPVLLQSNQQDVAEMNVLARVLAESFKSAVDIYIKEYKDAPDTAIEKVQGKSAHVIERALNGDPKSLNWFQLLDLANHDAELALKRWQQIKQQARDELLIGQYAIDQHRGEPYARALFIAIRAGFVEQWQPQNGGEMILVDMLAQLYAQYLFWLGALSVYSNLEAELERGEVKTKGKWKPTRITTAESIEQAGMMVDRFNRLFLRTLRALRDLRRWSVPVTINNPAQVNIGAQQVNAQQVQSE